MFALQGPRLQPCAWAGDVFKATLVFQDGVKMDPL